MKIQLEKLAPIFLMGMFTLIGCQNKTEANGDVQIAESGDQKGADSSEETPEEKVEKDDKFEQFSATTVDSCKSSLELRADEKIYTGFDGTSTFTSTIWLSMGCDLDLDVDALEAEYGEERLANLFDKLDEVTDMAKVIEASGKPTITIGDAAVLEENAEQSEGDEFYYKLALNATAAGESSVTIKIGEVSSTSTVVVKEYQAADVTAGQGIYDGTTAVEGMPSCASCHQSAKGVDHSPNLVGVCSDSELTGAITEGIYGNDDAGAEGLCTGYELDIAHSWPLESAQAQQVAAYLRTLPLVKPEPEEPAAAE